MTLNDNNSPAGKTDVSANEGVKSQDDAPKTFTQDEVNEVVRKRISEMKAKNEEATKLRIEEALAEYDRQSKLSDEQKADEALKKKNQEIEERERQVTLRERRSEALEILVKKELPTELVDFVVDEDADKTATNIDNLTEAWNKAMEEKVKEKIAGTTPKDRSSGANNANATTTPEGVYAKDGVSAF